MLLLIPVNHFNSVAVRRKAEKYLQKMSQKDRDLTSFAFVEIIPYEDLWEIVLDNLEAPKRKRVSQYSPEDWSLGRGISLTTHN